MTGMKTLLLVLLLGSITVQAQGKFESKLVSRTTIHVIEGERFAPRNIMEREVDYRLFTQRVTFNKDGNYSWYATNNADTGMFIRRREIRDGDKWVEKIPK